MNLNLEDFRIILREKKTAFQDELSIFLLLVEWLNEKHKYFRALNLKTPQEICILISEINFYRIFKPEIINKLKTIANCQNCVKNAYLIYEQLIVQSENYFWYHKKPKSTYSLKKGQSFTNLNLIAFQIFCLFSDLKRIFIFIKSSIKSSPIGRNTITGVGKFVLYIKLNK